VNQLRSTKLPKHLVSLINVRNNKLFFIDMGILSLKTP